MAKRVKAAPKQLSRTVDVRLTYDVQVSGVEVPIDADDHAAALIAEECVAPSEYVLVDWKVSDG